MFRQLPILQEIQRHPDFYAVSYEVQESTMEVIERGREEMYLNAL
jgi:hypothetical protein